MSEGNLVYIIPPYLLYTNLGLELQRHLRAIDPDLAARNAIVPSSTCHFRQPKHLISKNHDFCDDKQLNDAIKEKLKEKFAVAGVLGSSVDLDIPDDQFYELYEIFKSRLRMEGSHTAAEATGLTSENRNSSPLSSETTSSPGADSMSKSKSSVFESTGLGEFNYTPQAFVDLAGDKSPLPVSFLKNTSLTQLMKWARDCKEHKYSYSPYLMLDNRKTFLSPLPMYWTPLSIDKQLELLDSVLGMEINLENGYSTLEFKLNKIDFQFDDLIRKKRFFNFIANKEISDASIFYYEVLVEQTTTPATKYRPILLANDSSLSSGSSLFFSVGYTKRNIRFDKMPSTSGANSRIQSIDLKDVQNEIAFYNLDAYCQKLDSDTVTFLGAEPGISFEGSFAVSFNNSCSYASIKSGDTNYRTSSLNMNRRFSQINRQSVSEQETSRLDIEVPFTTHTKPEGEGNKVLRTDTIGCGVDFIHKTIFITLNGILVKTVHNDEIVTTNRYKDSLFEQGSEPTSLYPMIGFQLSELPKEVGEGDLPESKIITNFGQREFAFNINRYVKKLKTQQEGELSNIISEELKNSHFASSVQTDVVVSSFERSVRNLKDDPTLLNDFIKGYLLQEGFLETLESFGTDLDDLKDNTTQKADATMKISIESQNGSGMIQRSDAPNRHKLRSLISRKAFLEAAKLLKNTYPESQLIKGYITELEIMHYINLLKQYVGLKFGNDFHFENGSKNKASELFEEALDFGRYLLKCPETGSALRRLLGELSSVLLVQTKEELNELTHAKKLLDNLEREAENLANDVNLSILERLGFSRESKLERMITSAGRNIGVLCAQNDNAFKMINYERDYIETNL